MKTTMLTKAMMAVLFAMTRIVFRSVEQPKITRNIQA